MMPGASASTKAELLDSSILRSRHSEGLMERTRTRLLIVRRYAGSRHEMVISEREMWKSRGPLGPSLQESLGGPSAPMRRCGQDNYSNQILPTHFKVWSEIVVATNTDASPPKEIDCSASNSTTHS